MAFFDQTNGTINHSNLSYLNINSHFEPKNNSLTEHTIFHKPREIIDNIMEPNVQTFSHLQVKNHEDLIANSDSLNLETSWESQGFADQILHQEDGSVFNLSSIDWNSVNIYYEYDTSNLSSINPEVVTTGRAITLAVFALIFIVGLIGNILVVVTIARHLIKRRTTTHMHLLNLAVSDILYLMVCLPVLSVSYAFVDWKFGRVFCKLENYIMSVSVSVSAMTIMAAGLDRYMITTFPDRYRTFRSPKKLVLLICSIWILSCSVMAPRANIFEEISMFHKVGTITLCSRQASKNMLKADTVLNFLCLYLLPLFVNFLCQYRVSRKLKNSNIRSVKRNGHIEKLVNRERRTFSKIIIAVGVVFAVGWFPLHIYHLVEDFDEGNMLLGEYIDRGTVTLLFSFGARSLNPIVYCLLTGSFKKLFKDAFKCIIPYMLTSNSGNNLKKMPIDQDHEKEHKFYPSACSPRPVSLHSEELLPEGNKITSGERFTSEQASIFPQNHPLL